jgi:hypothetical protein
MQRLIPKPTAVMRTSLTRRFVVYYCSAVYISPSGVPFLLYYQLFNDTAFADTERSLIAYRTSFSFLHNAGKTRGWQIENAAAFRKLALF